MHVSPSRSNSRSIGRIRIHRSAKHRDRVMAAIAMPRKFDSLGAQQNVHARPIERRTKRVRMQRLPPLMVSFLVAMPAVLSIQEGTRLQKVPPHRGSVSGHGYLSVSEREVIALAHLFGICLAKSFLIRARVLLGSMRSAQAYQRRRTRHCNKNENPSRKAAHADSHRRFAAGPGHSEFSQTSAQTYRRQRCERGKGRTP